LVVKTISENVETLIATEKKTNNIGLKDRRDCRIYQREDGTTGIYFLSGSIYDYDTLAAIGSYTINDKLPEWAKVGRSIFVDELGDYIEITNILFDSELQKDVLVCTPGYVGIEIATIVQTLYNLFPWEIYEFTISMATYENKTLQVQIDVTNPGFDSRTKLSEKINVKEWQKNTIQIQYKSTENNDIFYIIDGYPVGISHVLRLEYEKFSPVTETEREVSKADTSIVAVKSDVYPKRQLILKRLSTMMADKVVQAFNQNQLSINGSLFTTESVESPQKQGSTNLHNVSIVLYKTKEQVESTFNDSGLIFPSGFVAPTLLDYEDGFIIVDPAEVDGLVSVI
jgi:hypothetical protein